MTDCPSVTFNTSPATLYYDQNGDVYTGPGNSGYYVCEVVFTTDTSVQYLYLERRDNNVPDLCKRCTDVIPQNGASARDMTWEQDSTTATDTLTFNRPTTGWWGWDFVGIDQPTPLKVKIRFQHP